MRATICTLSFDGILMTANAFGKTLLDISDEDIAAGISLFERLPDELADRCRSAMDRTIKRGEAGPHIFDVETRNGERKPAVWCFGREGGEDRLVALVLEADRLMASLLLPCEDFYDAHSLTCREREAMNLLTIGFEYKEIADRMNVSLPTVRSHIQSAYSRLGVHSRLELINLICLGRSDQDLRERILDASGR
jgi:Response regulator containing a CheY-like receiver domain and an HTH DNA-binding domain